MLNVPYGLQNRVFASQTATAVQLSVYQTLCYVHEQINIYGFNEAMTGELQAHNVKLVSLCKITSVSHDFLSSVLSISLSLIDA